MSNQDGRPSVYPGDIPELRAHSDEIRAKVEEFGWCAVAVDDVRPFAYTVGLWQRADHPEVILTGLPEDLSKQMLDIAASLVLGGRPIKDGDVLSHFMGELSVAVRQVTERNLPELGMAADFYRGLVFPAVQVVWPDRNGRFLWDRGAPKRYKAAQPALFELPRRTGWFGT